MQTRHFKANEKRTILSLGFALLIVIFLLCSCGSASTSSTSTSSASNSESGSTGTSSTTPTATGTKVPANTGSAYLGGSVNGFIAKYGKPNADSVDYHPSFEKCSNSKTDQLSLSQVSLESKTGPVVSVLAFACPSASWTEAQATTMCSAFFPPDAQYQRSVQVPAGNGYPPSVDKIYYSAMLAHVFAADNFTDNNGALVQPGLFDVNYFNVSSSDTSHFNECDLELGDSQTSTN